MKLEVGVYEDLIKHPYSNSDGWKIICEQEMTPHRVTNQPDYPVMVFEGLTPDWFPGFMEDGGIGIITDATQENLPFKTNFVSYAFIESIDLTELDSSITRVVCNANIFEGNGLGIISLHENRKKKLGVEQDEFPVFVFKSYGKGGCYYSGLPLTKLLIGLGDTLRMTPYLGEFTERIVSVDKHNIIRALRNILIRSFNLRDLPYVHLWYYPNDYMSVFTFRIDVDGAFDENLIRISETSLLNNFILTIFVNKSLCHHQEKVLLKINKQHKVGNHADIHNLFTDYNSNYNNIKKCKEWLDQLGVENGLWFAAPRGMWNYNLHRALHDMNYLFTSDFSCAIAGFPFFPYIFGKRTNTLQIPVNPFSAERASVWMNEKFGCEVTTDYVAESFVKIIGKSYDLNFPIMLYSHPEIFGPMSNQVFAEISEALEHLNVWKTSLIDFAKWWNVRDKSDYEVRYDNKSDELIVNGDLDSRINIKEVVIL